MVEVSKFAQSKLKKLQRENICAHLECLPMQGEKGLIARCERERPSFPLPAYERSLHVALITGAWKRDRGQGRAL